MNLKYGNVVSESKGIAKEIAIGMYHGLSYICFYVGALVVGVAIIIILSGGNVEIHWATEGLFTKLLDYLFL